MINFDDYKVTKENISKLVDVEKGYIFNPFIGYKGWSKIDKLLNPILPNLEINAKFHRLKTIGKTKVLHVTEELEIVDIEKYKAEAEKLNGKISQFIGDGEILTILEYREKEDIKTFYNRVLKEMKASHLFYSKEWYKKRFGLDGMTDDQRIEFTKILLDNACMIINHLSELSIK